MLGQFKKILSLTLSLKRRGNFQCESIAIQKIRDKSFYNPLNLLMIGLTTIKNLLYKFLMIRSDGCFHHQ